MTSGGARNRSGPTANEDSARSDRRGFSLQKLPASGWAGNIPDWPLPELSPRELDLWTWAWRTPQAWAWAQPSEQWRSRSVAMWVRLAVRCEDTEAGAALLAQLHRFADQIGMTTAGLAEMGWKVATDEVAEKRAAAPEPKKRSSRDRMKVVGGGQ